MLRAVLATGPPAFSGTDPPEAGKLIHPAPFHPSALASFTPFFSSARLRVARVR